MVIELQQLALLIENELNEIANMGNVNKKFRVHADLGDYVNPMRQNTGELQDYINGVLIQATGDFTKIECIENINSNYSLEFIVKQDEVPDVRNILNDWAKCKVGRVFSVGDTNYLLTPTQPETGYAKDSRLGSSIPLRININVQSIARGLLSNMVVWKIDGEEVKLENSSISINRTTSTKPQANNDYTTTFNDYSTTTITMIIPYSFSEVNNKIALNLLEDKKDQTFIISRNDTVHETSHTYILVNGSITEESGKIVAIQCTFMRARENGTV